MKEATYYDSDGADGCRPASLPDWRLYPLSRLPLQHIQAPDELLLICCFPVIFWNDNFI